jgi:hypothetical protein
MLIIFSTLFHFCNADRFIDKKAKQRRGFDTNCPRWYFNKNKTPIFPENIFRMKKRNAGWY